jgi:hypothetical protein
VRPRAAGAGGAWHEFYGRAAVGRGVAATRLVGRPPPAPHGKAKRAAHQSTRHQSGESGGGVVSRGISRCFVG